MGSGSRGGARRRAGYESDRWRLFTIKRADGKVRDLTEVADRNIRRELVAGFDAAVFHGGRPRPAGHPDDCHQRRRRDAIVVSGSATYDDVQFTPDGKTMIYTMQTGASPVEITGEFAGQRAGAADADERELLAGVSLPPFEDSTRPGPRGRRFIASCLKPPGFEAEREVPGTVSDSWRTAGGMA